MKGGDKLLSCMRKKEESARYFGSENCELSTDLFQTILLQFNKNFKWIFTCHHHELQKPVTSVWVSAMEHFMIDLHVPSPENAMYLPLFVYIVCVERMLQWDTCYNARVVRVLLFYILKWYQVHWRFLRRGTGTHIPSPSIFFNCHAVLGKIGQIIGCR